MECYSNIGSAGLEPQVFFEILKSASVELVELAPGIVLPSWPSIVEKEVEDLQRQLKAMGLSVLSLQGITYGVENINFLSSRNSCDRLLNHLEGVCELAARLTCHKVVFGAPNLRVSSDGDFSHASYAFAKIDELFSKHQIFFCIEPVTRDRGLAFLQTHFDVQSFCKRYSNYSALRVNFDTGIFLKEDLAEQEAFANCDLSLVGHVQISSVEPSSFQLGNAERILAMLHKLQLAGYTQTYSIESFGLNTTQDLLNLIRYCRSLGFNGVI